ncbi:hypothetical protein [Roseisalinus antarcticus]|uniref:Uncharacterized protein n=1 Tax=Roseisalinus antarcticus TaxID=254357 RepID=A0A1Y5SHE4_9RHOB|nr:hypothetical protein [Roseisalinus antarcticus]SLN40897.1 hypothetical protein ROA7023_01606 [Roseisalinus antarcticus]
MADQKIATCCYCGTRAALVLRGTERHELSCASCGAPLHDMKRLKAVDREPVRRTAPAATPPRPGHPARGQVWRGKKKKSKKKSLKARAFGELWDIVEDIFD